MTIVKRKIGGGSVRYVKYSEAKAGDVLVTGLFQGTDMVPSYDKKSEVPIHTFVTEDEEIVKLNSAGQLNKLLSTINPGTLLEVTFLGKEKFKSKDGRTLQANQFEVNELVEE